MRRVQTVTRFLLGLSLVVMCSGPVVHCECGDTGIGGSAALEVDRTIIQFADVAQGYPQTRTIHISSMGRVGIVFNTLAIDGGAASPFSILGRIDPLTEEIVDPPTSLYPGDSMDLVIRYDPATADAEDFDILRIDTNDKDVCHSDENPCQIQLTGTAAPPDPELEVVCQRDDICVLGNTPLCQVITTPDGEHPTKVLFNYCDVAVGGGVQLDVLIKNAGNIPLSFDGMAFDSSYGDPSVFRIVAPREESFELRPLEERMMSISYVPTVAGGHAARINLATNDLDIVSDQAPGVFRVSLLGQASEPDIDVFPENIPFTGVTQGSSDTQTITVHNTGTGNLIVSGVEVIGGSVQGEFSVDRTEEFAVPGGSMADIQVTYSPQDVGADDGAVTIYSNDPDEPQVVVTLGGEVRPDLDVVPSVSVEFVDVPPAGSDTQDVILTNVGYADLTISAMSLSLNPGDPPVFALAGLPADFPGTPLVLAPAESYTFQVSFTDNTNIADEIGQLDIAHDSPNDTEPYPLLLRNSGTPANLPPVAVVDPPTQVVHGTQAVYLDASGSFDPDTGDSISGYSWSFLFKPQDAQGNNSQAVLDSTDQVSTSFTPDMVGQYVVRLVVYDSFGTPSLPVDAEISVNQ